jgi:exopolysaccharide biosynthesis polyprenyl glycosylphosphotransferase
VPRESQPRSNILPDGDTAVEAEAMADSVGERVPVAGDGPDEGASAVAADARRASEPAVLTEWREHLDYDTGERFWRDVRRRRMLALADVLAALAASAVAVSSLSLLTWAILFLPVWILLAKLVGLYDRDHRAIRHLTLDEMPQIAAWAGLGAAGLALFLPLTPAGSLPAETAVLAALVALGAAAVLRSLARVLYRRLTPREQAVVIGDGAPAWAARRKIELFSDMHLELAPASGLRGDGSRPSDDEVRAIARRVDRIVVAWEHVDPEWIGHLATICRDSQVKLSVVSPLRGQASALPRLSEIGDLPVLEYDTWDLSRSTLLIKRVVDVVLASGLLVALLPLFPFVALAIKLDSRGPVLFTQLRAGLGGRPFRVYKLRTMQRDAEARLGELVDLGQLDEPVFKLRDDPRVTRLGRMLRRLSIDELPQLVNVVKGEMSLVGPRPEVLTVVEHYKPEHCLRFTVRPGMTGPMQVFGRGALTFSERLSVELDYIDRLSLARDFRIIGQTIPAIIRGTGAF